MAPSGGRCALRLAAWVLGPILQSCLLPAAFVPSARGDLRLEEDSRRGHASARTRAHQTGKKNNHEPRKMKALTEALALP